MSHSAVVLDASVTATWLLPDEASPASRAVFVRIRRGSLVPHAPELWLWECGNIIANGVKRNRITPEDALLTWSVLDAIRTRVELTNPAPAQTRAALTLAIDDGLSLHDAAYLWLAMSLKLPLLSTEQALSRAAVRRGVTVVGLEAVA